MRVKEMLLVLREYQCARHDKAEDEVAVGLKQGLSISALSAK